MKLYTRGQIVFTTIIVGVVVFGLSVFGSSEYFRKVKPNEKTASEKTESNSSEAGEKVTALKNQNESLSDLLETTPEVQAAIPVSDTVTYTQGEIQNITVYEKCSDAVVNINTQVVAYDWFLEPYVQDGGSGSGSIIDKRGYILTNVHVIQNATKIYVSLSDGTQYEASIVGQDADSDLAVIKFDPPEGVELKTIQFGDSTGLKVGQKVIAIGNPYGLARTMTTGIVSSLGRPLKDSATGRIINNMIQTDAAINPGNSGGPLLDTNGRMIGINTMIVSNSNSSAGVGFAVPSETAVRVVKDLIRYGKVRRGTMEINVIQLTSRIAQYARLDVTQGMLVSQVTKGSLAEKAGLRGGTEAVYYGNRRNVIYLGGDVIRKIDNTAITSLADYYLALESKRPGDTVTVTVRRDKKDVELKITLEGDTDEYSAPDRSTVL
ncbi:MAG: trypsin-like peptidase domain-containing protein [Treponema sp.]|nr:trypsin-like peptidase domain-containing protein [Treponema sp.]